MSKNLLVTEYVSVDALLGRSLIRRRILNLMVAEPDRRRHLSDIARSVDTSAGTASRELRRLMDADLVVRTTEGRQVYYQAKRDSVIFRSVSDIVRNTTGAVQVIRDQLRGLAGLESALIYGSYASGAIRADSDIDLLIVGSPDRDALTDRLESASRDIGREVNETVFTFAELESRRRRGDGFIRSIDDGQTIPVLP